MNLPKHWRQRGTRYRLEGQRHRESGIVRFPAQPARLDERGDEWQTELLSGRGVIYSYTGVRQAASDHEATAPYLLALVQLDEGPLLTAQLTDCAEADLAIGMPVEMVTRRLYDPAADDLLVYAYKFRPLLGS